MGQVRRQQGTVQIRTPVCQPGSITELHDLGQDFPSVSSSIKWDYPDDPQGPSSPCFWVSPDHRKSLSQRHSGL